MTSAWMFKALIFDLDGLLLDTERLCLTTWSEAARACGHGVTEEIAKSTIGLDHFSTRAYYEERFEGRFPYEEVEAKHRALFRARIREAGVPLKLGVREILAEAHRLGLKVGLATSSRSVYAHAMLWLAEIDHAFHAVATRSLVEAGKPAPDVYLKAADMLNVAPSECLAFEDSRNGILAARAAGIPVVMIPDLIEPTEELRRLCQAIVPSLLEATPLLSPLSFRP